MVYDGIIKSIDQSGNGIYKVYVPSLSSSLKKEKHVRAKNRVNNFASWINPSNQEIESIGSYLPLSVGMSVKLQIVKSKATIISLNYDSTPFDSEHGYLMFKTKKGTQIFSDDNKEITSILQSGGNSSIVLDNDKVVVSVNQISKNNAVSSNNIANIQVTKSGVFLMFGKNGIKIDDSGVSLIADESKINLTKDTMHLDTTNTSFDIDKLDLGAKNLYILGSESVNIKGTHTKISGNQNLSLTGNVINIFSMLMTSLQSNNAVFINGKISTLINSINLGIKAIGNLWLKGATVSTETPLLTLSGATTAINGGTIFMDSTVMRGFGGASSIGSSLSATTTALEVGIMAGNTGLITGLHLSDPFTGMACATITNGLAGSADAPSEMVKLKTELPDSKFIGLTIKSNLPITTPTTNLYNSLAGKPLEKVIPK